MYECDNNRLDWNRFSYKRFRPNGNWMVSISHSRLTNKTESVYSIYTLTKRLSANNYLFICLYFCSIPFYIMTRRWRPLVTKSWFSCGHVKCSQPYLYIQILCIQSSSERTNTDSLIYFYICLPFKRDHTILIVFSITFIGRIVFSCYILQRMLLSFATISINLYLCWLRRR